ncbi:HNH endonuclease signature motif containing protein [Cryobacterium sp. N19]|uniref:HNH endonuclease signature motif containing protein n=1 Tax=Cryobacterium sp. N19 TaxID=2048288 RepID=UPI0013048616|nr:HNH endonuclease signature motif containing protein [Cryobacterium sp. N19]
MAPMFMENPSESSSNPVVVAVEQAREILLAALGGVSFGLLGDEESLTLLLAVESVGRVVDGARVLSTSDVLRRSQYFDAAAAKAAAQAAVDQSAAAAQNAAREKAGSGKAAAESVIPEGAAADAASPSVARAAASLAAPTLARRLGCRSGVELVCTLARLSRSEVRQRAVLGEKAGQRMLLGRPLAPTYPVLDGLRSEVLASDLDRVERSLVASGSGAITPETEGLPGAGIAFAPELLRQQGIQWKARLAPDGTAPGEAPTERRSWLTFGTLNNGGYSLNGWFTTFDRAIIGNVCAGQLSDAHLFAAAANPVPGADGAGNRAYDRISPHLLSPCPQQPDDIRSRSEKQAGILRAVFEAAARHPGTPTMGGAAPTVLVHINITDLLAGRGAGWIDGIDGPLTPHQVDELICAGGYQPILFGHTGTILHLGTSNRFFTASQRRALAARDGGCVIPGCTVPPHLTQVHHVVPWRQGGLTDIDNAVLICNAAHSSIDTSGWDIDMRDGRPWIRGPLIFDPTHTWRPAGQNRAATAVEKPTWEK